jgi:hypothetical protein
MATFITEKIDILLSFVSRGTPVYHRLLVRLLKPPWNTLHGGQNIGATG